MDLPIQFKAQRYQPRNTLGKSEIRNPKLETNSNAPIRKLKTHALPVQFRLTEIAIWTTIYYLSSVKNTLDAFGLPDHDSTRPE
jgi:hypothetical protein